MLVSAVQQSESAICIHIPSPFLASLSRTLHPTPLGHHRALSWVPMLYSSLPLAGYLHASVCISMLLSQFILPSPSSTVSTCPFSMSVSLFLPGNRFICFKKKTFKKNLLYLPSWAQTCIFFHSNRILPKFLCFQSLEPTLKLPSLTFFMLWRNLIL